MTTGTTTAAKLCPGCGEAKEPDAFHADRSRPDGKQRLCKTCVQKRDAQRDWTGGGERRGKLKTARRKGVLTHSKEVMQATWYAGHREDQRARVRAQRAELR